MAMLIPLTSSSSPNSGMTMDSVRYPCATVLPNGPARLGVHVDPLMVAGRVGEGVDAFLGDLEPARAAEIRARLCLELVQAIHDRGHAGVPPPGRAVSRPRGSRAATS